MDRFNEKIAGGVGLLAAVLAVGCVGLGAWTGLLAFAALGYLLLFAALVSGVVYGREGLARRAEEERLDAERAAREQPDASLFRAREGEPEPFSVARTRLLMERMVSFAVPPLMAVLQGLAAWHLYRKIVAPFHAPVQNALLSASLLAGAAFLTFLIGRYLSGLGREPSRRLLRGPGAWFGLAAWGALLGLGSSVAAEWGWPAADRGVAAALGAGLALLAVESAARAIAEGYRPRRGRAEPGAPYESGLARALTDPARWFRGAAQSLDFQFGFRVSETWLYRFTRGALVPLLIFQLAAMYLLSCVVALAPEEEGILERFGRPREEASGGWRLEPGLHFKWPWPFETVRRFPARRLLTTHVGYSSEETALPETMLWTRPHFAQEDEFLVASRETGAASTPLADRAASVPVSLLAFNIPIEYRIVDLRLFAYGHADPARALREIAYRCVTRETAGRDLFDIMGVGQQELVASLHRRMQAEADRQGLGVRVEFVGLQGVHPPVAIAEAFEKVVGAMEEKEAAILRARAYASRVLPVARAQAHRQVVAAEAERTARTAEAEAEARQFEKRKAAIARAPAVARQRYYLASLEQALRASRKYIVAAAPGAEVLQFNFEEKTPSALLDLSPDTPGRPEETPR